MEETDKTDKEQKPWLFKKGQSGNPNGRPKGSISIKDKIRKRLEENPEEFEALCDFYLKDKKMRELLWKMIDGLPKQSVELGLEETISEVKIEIVKNKENEEQANNKISQEESSPQKLSKEQSRSNQSEEGKNDGGQEPSQKVGSQEDIK